MNAPLTIEEAGAGLRAGKFSSRDLTQAAFTRIDRHNDRLGAVLARCDETALAAAERADRELAVGKDRGPLHGIPLALKDVLATADAPTTAQSLAMFPGYQGFDSRVAARLRQAGAVLVAKAACSEFALGTPDASKPFPFPRNPWDLDRWAGGSSGGCASGLLAGFFLGSVGTDSGGSIRIPAAFCGVTGLKPTAGIVPRDGVVPLSYSTDHVGPMARTARDCALLLAAMTGHDPGDNSFGMNGMRIGVERHYHADVGVPPEMTCLFERAVADMEAAGARIVDIDVPFSGELATATRIVLGSEALEIHRNNLRARWSDYGKPTRAALATAVFYSAADYARARRVLAAGRRLVAEVFDTVDCIASLTCPMVAWRFGDISLREALRAPVFTNRWNGLGLPAISVPIGMHPVDGVPTGLPVGMQLAGARNADADVLAAAAAYQANTNWHLQVPPFFAETIAGLGRSKGGVS